MSKLEIERQELNAFSVDILEQASRDLNLLRAIDNTLAWLTRLSSNLTAAANFAEEAASATQGYDAIIDPEHTLVGGLEAAQVCVNELYSVLIDKRQCGREDHQLTEEDGIESAYCDAIASAADLHNNINSLRWSIMEHDADLAPPSNGSHLAETSEDIDRIFAEIIGE